MIDLTQAFKEIQADQLSVLDFASPQWQIFVNANQDLFARVQTAKPDKSIHSLLLGLLTKTHIETFSRVTDHQSSAQAMQQTFKQELGNQHAANFHYQDGEQLTLITHLWLYLQGYLNMDFSLANDHAEQCATMLTQIGGGDPHALRSAFMASFYLGKQSAPQSPSSGFLAKIKQLFQ